VRIFRFSIAVCVLLVWGGAVPPLAPMSRATGLTNASPLIVEKNEGERRVWRVEGFAAHFVLKIDPQNGGSSHLVFGTEDLPPGGKIDPHKHPEADEILYLQNGVARVSLGNSAREVHGGATVFIPAGTWISVTNIGNEAISTVFAFSAPGFEDFMRAESVREGQKMIPLSKAEDEAIMKKYSHAVVYQ
jgi:quercetin dioxygenase-like cupin family protein